MAAKKLELYDDKRMSGDVDNETSAPLRVLIFEDDEGVRSLLVSLVSDAGFEIEAFADPSLCPLALDPSCDCPHARPCCDVLISDVHMPSISGIDFLAEQRRKGCKVKNVALVSGEWSAANRLRAQQMGCKIFEKPFRLAELTEWLEQVRGSIASDRKLSSLQGDIWKARLTPTH